MVVCKNCGKENQPHYKFCLYCGSDIQAEPPQRGDGEGATIPVRDVAPAEPDSGETPLPAPRPPPTRFSGEVAMVSRPGLGPERLGPRLPEGLGGPKAAESAAPAETEVKKPETALRPELATKVCPTCNSLVPVGFQFCGQCGGRVDQPAAPAATGSPGKGPQAHPAPRLVLIRPDGSEGGTYPLSGGVNLVGRGSGPLFDADSYLSPLHLQIEVREPPYFVLRDAGSLNGVFVKLTEEEPVSDEAVFRIGQELLRFDAIRMPRPLDDGTEVMGSPNPGYWGRIAIIIGRGQDGSCFPLFGDAVVLGRERGDILFAEDGYVSGTHARISYRHGQVYLQDLASSNGTFLKIRGERTVRSGTYMLMGQQLFRVLSG